ncbi:MAG: alpha-galactosidase [Clostridia bacterium]|nr:alpha-galactosidase [Clostridia bacterium]
MKNKDFMSVYTHDENGKKIFSYRGKMTVYEEELRGGRLTTSGFNSSGYTLNVLEDMPRRLSGTATERFDTGVFSLEVNGASVSYGLEYIGHTNEKLTRENGSEYILAKVSLKNPELSVKVNVCTELDGTGVIARYLEIENLSDRKINLSGITPMRGILEELEGWNAYMKAPDPSGIYSVGFMESSRWGCEGLFKWHSLHTGIFGIPGRYNADRYRHPAFFLKNNLTGGIFAVQLAYTGGYEFSLNLMAEPEQSGGALNSILAFDVKITSPSPQYILKPKERYTTPKVHITRIFGSLDDAVNEMHAHTRRSVLTKPHPSGVNGLLAAGMGTERVMTVSATKHFADTAAYVGAEALIIDAGWFCPPGKGTEWNARSGDWYPDPDLYPNGIEEIIDYIRSKGLLFGIWIDPERIGRASNMAKEHPEWLGKSYSSGGTGSIIDMTIPEAAEWVENEIARVITETNADLFRLDYNIGTREIFVRSSDGESHFCNTLAYYEAVYDMYERLRKRFPHVFFENCAGGGGRTDLGMMQNFDHTWVSDWQIAPASFAITNGMTMVLPPEYVDRLASGMNCHTKGALDFQIRHTLFGKPTTNSYNANGSEYNPCQLDFVRHSYDIYKNFVRPYAADSLVYHHTPEINGLRPVGTGVIERSSADRTRSMIGVFRLSDAYAKEPVTVFPKGIDISGEYKVVLDNLTENGEKEVFSVVSGYELINRGIRVDLESSLTSELILIEKI